MNIRATVAATLVLLLLSMVIYAQDPPAPAADFVPEQWKEVLVVLSWFGIVST